ncbi:hypothetical protein CR513_28703 [Mucuna pruriens]|uniref:Uncharacterized protein n=1 Tax=Mucuna pruriens TaxID=157652 RepID=A0A371GGD2_MUCPR|nr:hypothetical protein CR513_28703 [Mucuna pruriens]
MFHSEQLQP